MKQLFPLVLSLLPMCALYGQPEVVLSNPSDCRLGLPLTDASCPENSPFFQPNRFTINVVNAPGTALGADVYLQEVQLIVAHTWLSDLEITLFSPSGRSARLVADNGGGDDHYGDPEDEFCSRTLRLTLAACTSVADGKAPFLDGPYRALDDFYVFNDNSSPNGNWRLQICDDLVNDFGRLEYVSLIFAPISCLPAQNLSLLNVDSTTVGLTYSPTDICGPAIVEVGPPGFTPGTGATAGAQGQVFNVDCPPFELTGLNEDTEYDVYLRRFCPNNGAYSANSCGLRIRTGCRPPPTTAVETFDDQANCVTFCNSACPLTGFWRNVTNDGSDWIAHSGNTPTAVGTGPGDDVTGGGKYVYLEANGSACPVGSSTYLQSGCIVLDKRGTDTCHLSFNYHMYGISMGSLRLEASADGGLNWTTLWQRNGNQGNRWYKAYIGLGQYADGTRLQLRFVGVKGNGPYGDMALDQIVLHGSQADDFPTTRYYVDGDGDGYGRTGIGVLSCLPTAPAGYAPNNTDCNDNNSAINPGATEIACNGVDENCNAATSNDDVLLPAPTVTNDTVCSGQTAMICAQARPQFSIRWYDAPSGGNVVGFGECFTPTLPTNNDLVPAVYRFYAEETNFTCFSAQRSEATIVVHPLPEGQVGEMPSVCPGSAVDLRAANVQDVNFTGAEVSFHSALPATTANRLTNTVVQPTVTTTYYYLLTSPAGCTDAGELVVNVSPSLLLTYNPADSFSLCRDALDTVRVSVSGGTGEYSYQWSNGLTGNSLPVSGGNIAGQISQYRLTVTDAAGCEKQDTVFIRTTNSIDSLRVITQAVSNCNGTNGRISVIPLNGLPPFSYRWRDANGQTGQGTSSADTIRIDNLEQGSYRISVTDNSPQGCTAELRNVRVQGPGFQVLSATQQTPSCAGDANGRICLNVTGTGTISYSWSTGATTACAENLSSGTYEVTITNGQCTTVETFQLTQPDSLRTVADLTDPTCASGANGRIAVTVFGGTPNYTYRWNRAGTSGIQNNLAGGSYLLTVTDSRGCTRQDTFVLQPPPPLVINTDSIAFISCPGDADGLILISADGGTPFYRYRWEDGSRGPLRFQLGPGNYSVTLTDLNGCEAYQTYELGDPTALALSVAFSAPPLCRGDRTGSVVLSPTGGRAPYEFIWDDGLVSSQTVRENLGVGQYRVRVRDAGGCESEDLIIDLQPESNIALIVDRTPPTCVGRNDGRLRLIPQGVGAFTYRWGNGSTNAQRNNLGVGSYPVTITNNQNCVLDTVLTLDAVQVFELQTIVEPPSCNGALDGLIDVIFVRAGTAPFQFNWNDGSQHVDRFNLGPGEYRFTATDAIGCRYQSDTFNLDYPPRLRLSVDDQGGLACRDDSTGFFETTISGGTPPYQINWMGREETSEDLYGLTAGDYRLMIEDDRGCPIDTVLRLVAPPQLQLDVVNLGLDRCQGGVTDTLLAVVTGGSGPFTYLWSNDATTQRLVKPDPGDYSLSVTDAKGCTVSMDGIKVRARVSPLKLDQFTVKAVSCFGANDASATAAISGGSGQYLYHFTPTYLTYTDSLSISRMGLAHNSTYSVTVTDLATGCQVTSNIVRPVQPLPLVTTLNNANSVNCFGGADGGIDVSVSGGTQPYNYRWRNEAGSLISTLQDLTMVMAGRYSLVTTDAKGCRDSLAVTLRATQSPIRVIDSLTVMRPVACRGDATGALDIRVQGGEPPYRYQWSNGAMTEDLVNVPAGNYALTITDADTCRTIFPDFTVTQPATALTLNPTVRQITCHGRADGRIIIGVTGGSGPFIYSWRRDGVLVPSMTGAVQVGLRSALYSVAVLDANGCTKSQQFQLDQPDSLVIHFSLEGGNGNGPHLKADVEGGTPPYRYLWSTGDTTATTSVPRLGPYGLMITDANGCQTSSTYIVTDTYSPTWATADLQLQPNPSTGIFSLHWRGPQTLVLDWQLLLPTGQWVDQGTVSLPPGGALPFDLGRRPAGVYFLRLRDEAGAVVTMPVVIAK